MLQDTGVVRGYVWGNNFIWQAEGPVPNGLRPLVRFPHRSIVAQVVDPQGNGPESTTPLAGRLRKCGPNAIWQTFIVALVASTSYVSACQPDCGTPLARARCIGQLDAGISGLPKLCCSRSPVGALQRSRALNHSPSTLCDFFELERGDVAAHLINVAGREPLDALLRSGTARISTSRLHGPVNIRREFLQQAYKLGEIVFGPLREYSSPDPFPSGVHRIGHGLALRGHDCLPHSAVLNALLPLDQTQAFQLGDLRLTVV